MSQDEDEKFPASGHEEAEMNVGPKDSKGKQKEDATLGDRMKKSANMFVSSLAEPRGESISSLTASKPGQSQHRDQEQLQGDLGDASTAPRTSQSLGQSIRTHSSNDAAESSFNSFQQENEPLENIRHEAMPQSHEVQWAEATDGHAVIHLLNESPTGAGVLDVFAPTETDSMINPEEVQRLRQALFNQPRKAAPWTTLLNPAHDLLPQLEDAQTTHALTGTTDTESAQQQWLEQWRDVLASYNEEVWGDLGPLAAEAQAELSQNPEAIGSGKEHQALDRLRLILAHVRG